uniref:GH18 domain-containing protein n=1 Tax=Manihot esculenta TaxID=3983 RepID=A0A2C9W0E4_MANES
MCLDLQWIESYAVKIWIEGANSKLFREYIGAESESIKLSHVPINSDVEFHFIISFAIDYTSLENPSPTNGKFNPFWASSHVTPQEIASIKHKNPNVKIAVSLGGDTIGHKKAYFAPKSINSWVKNAISSLTHMIKHYNIDGIDIDYEHFRSDPDTFSECIGRLITSLKRSGTISFSSIAPYDDDGEVQSHYLQLWKQYGNEIDYVNFQFYAYERISPSQFVKHFNKQAAHYGGGQILASFISGGGSGGLSPDEGFFEACQELREQEKLGGIFIWSADDSKKHGFKGEKEAQAFLAD